MPRRGLRPPAGRTSRRILPLVGQFRRGAIKAARPTHGFGHWIDCRPNPDPEPVSVSLETYYGLLQVRARRCAEGQRCSRVRQHGLPQYDLNDELKLAQSILEQGFSPRGQRVLDVLLGMAKRGGSRDVYFTLPDLAVALGLKPTRLPSTRHKTAQYDSRLLSELFGVCAALSAIRVRFWVRDEQDELEDTLIDVRFLDGASGLIARLHRRLTIDVLGEQFYYVFLPGEATSLHSRTYDVLRAVAARARQGKRVRTERVDLPEFASTAGCGMANAGRTRKNLERELTALRERGFLAEYAIDSSRVSFKVGHLLHERDG